MFRLFILGVIFALSVILGVIRPDLALASVSLKNLNFTLAHKHLALSGGMDPNITFVYNSKSPHEGLVGYNWGFEFEVYLEKSPDGSLEIHEMGSGAINRFSPTNFNKKVSQGVNASGKPTQPKSDLEFAVETIFDAAKKKGAIGGAADMARYRERLSNDPDFRNDEARKLKLTDIFANRAIPVGAQYISDQFGFQYITKVDGGFLRTYDGSRTERFDDKGRLIQMTDKNNNFVKLEYNSDGKQIKRVIDNFNRKMDFTYNSKGLIERITTPADGKYAEFKYNDKRELSWAKDAEGQVFEYKYDGENHHNMIEITMPDKSKMTMKYYGVDKNESVRQVVENGIETNYEYTQDPADPLHITIRVKARDVKDDKGKFLSDATYEYYDKKRPAGEKWTYKLVTNIDGDKTEQVFDEKTELPLVIRHNGKETIFAYDKKSHVIKKESPSEMTLLDYHPTLSKVTKVEVYRKNGKIKTLIKWSKFQYDPKGNLVEGANNEKKFVKIVYDTYARIFAIADQDKRQVRFKYNENSKPIDISVPGLGAIRISYKNNGTPEIESTAGSKVISVVDGVFNNLKQIVEPAGVDLSMGI